MLVDYAAADELVVRGAAGVVHRAPTPCAPARPYTVVPLPPVGPSMTLAPLADNGTLQRTLRARTLQLIKEKARSAVGHHTNEQAQTRGVCLGVSSVGRVCI
jgi:hypothetical protein